MIALICKYISVRERTSDQNYTPNFCRANDDDYNSVLVKGFSRVSAKTVGRGRYPKLSIFTILSFLLSRHINK
jgi:hypothetical protein